MKKKYSFEIIFKALIIIALSCLISQHLYAVGVEVYPESILFDYNSESFADDALTIRNATGGTADLPEWDSFENRNNSIAYIKGQANRQIQVVFKSDYEGIVHLIIKLTVKTGRGIGTVSNLFIPNYNTEYSNYLPLNLTGALPDSVSKQTFTWNWEIYAIPICAPGYSSTWKTTETTHTYYTILAAPQAPMAEPWSSVLEKACTWAGGQTTSSGIAQTVVQGLYNYSGFLYDVIDGSSRYTGQQGTSFNLHTMLSEIGGTNIPVNCYDMGKAVTIFINALGCISSYALSNPFSYVNCIKPIGRGWTNNPFYEAGYPYSTLPIVGEDDSEDTKPLGRTKFYNHAFCTLDNIVYDACLKVDTDSNPDAPSHIESWAIGWDWANYKSKVIDNKPAPPIINYPQPYSFTVY